MLVSGIVIDDEMDHKVLGHGLINAFEETEKLLMAMAGFAFGEDSPRSDVEGGKESGCAMANVVVCDPFHVAQAHRQHRLGTVQSLNLGLLIDRKYAAEADRNLKLCFDDNAPQSLLDLFTSYRSVK